MKKSGLGAGIGALFSETTLEDISPAENGIIEININDIEPGMGQPRTNFDKEKIEQLAASIKEHGIIQPLIVRKEGKVYRIIAGERRWRAARVAGLKKVPVIEKNASDREVIEMALIENIQREDLNPLEEALAYERLINEYELTQEELSKIVSKSRPLITNKMRLLDLPDEVKTMVTSGEIAEGHARTLLGIKDKDLIENAAKSVQAGGLSVRQTEALVKKLNASGDISEKPAQKKTLYDIAVKEVEKKLTDKFKAKVSFSDKNGKGKIAITFTSSEERERILTMLLDD